MSSLIFKVPAVLLLAGLVAHLGDHGSVLPGHTDFCPVYVQAEFQYFSIFIFSYITIALALRGWRVRQRFSRGLRRDTWPRIVIVLDGAAALLVELISAPWLLEGVRESLQLPPSPVVARGLLISNDLTVTFVGSVIAKVSGAGKSFVETGTEELNRKFHVHQTTMFCPGDSYSGRWLLAFVFAVLLIPSAIGLTFDWFSSGDRVTSIFTLGLSDSDVTSDESVSRYYEHPGLLGLGWVVILMYGILDVTISVIRLASGV